MALRKYGHHVAAITSPFTLLPEHGVHSCYIALLPSVRRKRTFLYVGSTIRVSLLVPLRTRCKGQRQPCSGKGGTKNVTSHDILRSERQRLLAQSVGIVFRQFLPVIRSASRVTLPRLASDIISNNVRWPVRFETLDVEDEDQYS